MAATETVKFLAGGDVTAFHKEPESGYKYIGPVLREGDIVFAQNERHYTNTPRDRYPMGGFTELTVPEHAQALKLGNYTVMSFASNHAMDLGPDVLLETIGVLKNLGIVVIGAGANITEARKPAFIERKGVKMGFLAYCSVLRNNCQASATGAGSAPMRAYTHYLQTDYQPGTAPTIMTFPYKEDLAALLDDVKKARSQCDVLAMSMHWGLHGVKGAIAMYQKEVAYAAIDAGVDIILGHHPHRLKGIEVYKGKPIFYSMGNFCFDQPRWVLEEGRKRSPEHALHMDKSGFKSDPEWDEWYAVPAENRKSMLVKCDIVDKKIRRVCFLPIMINNKAQPRILSRADKDFDDVLNYVKEITENQEMNTKYVVEGDEVVVSLT
jgi:Bacterial capsule synthesis protein PGA_cap